MGQCWKSEEQFNVPVGYELSYSATSPVQTGLVMVWRLDLLEFSQVRNRTL